MKFYKYQGTGNDFVMIDNRDSHFLKDKDFIQRFCHRRFGVGADGLILLENDHQFDFKMVYYNSDGNQSTMCGNGGRCIVSFAKYLNIFSSDITFFRAIDGVHQAKIEGDVVSLKMQNVEDILEKSGDFFVQTGSPHHIVFSQNVEKEDVFAQGKKIRCEIYKEEGANVNFVEVDNPNRLKVRTYERGVENETYSCGTGAVACAVVAHYCGKVFDNTVFISTLGGDLQVRFTENRHKYTDVWLTGEVFRVFNGEYVF